MKVSMIEVVGIGHQYQHQHRDTHTCNQPIIAAAIYCSSTFAETISILETFALNYGIQQRLNEKIWVENGWKFLITD